MNKDNIDFLNVGLTVIQPNDVKVLDSVISLHTYQVDSTLDKICKLPFFQQFNQESLYRIIYTYCYYSMSFFKPVETQFVLDGCLCTLNISISYKSYK